MSAWRCCCCPAHGEANNPEQALRDHWAWDCPVRATAVNDPLTPTRPGQGGPA